ncbi:hypothetical protein BC829DRAFT_369011 [Chytridium lagenaria]|nr:hypothetical protein BC829DRAFT_369011 [Chytridium lagenaria]
MMRQVSVDLILKPAYDALANVYIGPVILLACAVLLGPFSGWLLYLTLSMFALIVLVLHLMRMAQPVPVVNWWNEVVLITGGSHGVGLGLVEILLEKYKPKKIIVLDINEYDFKNSSVAFFKCDVSSFASVSEVAQRVLAEVGCPTMVINNAGIVNGKMFTELSEKEIQRVINVNLMGPMWIVKAYLPHMLTRNKGHIVNVASVMGMSGARSMVDYCASKFGLVGFNESLRQEVHNTNIQVSAIFPGLINTGMFDGVVFKFPWLTPPLETSQVVNAIMDVLIKNRSTEYKIPFFVELSPLLRALPIEITDWFKEAIGANDSMHTFSKGPKGKSK